MISSLPGKALRTLVDIARLEPGKLDIKRCKLSEYQGDPLFKLANMT